MSSNDVPASGESIWLEANRYYDAERAYYTVTVQEFMKRANPGHNLPNGMSQSSLASEIAYARQKIQNFLKASDSVPETSICTVLHRLDRIEKEQNAMKQKIETLTSQMNGVQCQLSLISTPPMQQTNTQNKDITQIKKNEAKGNIQNGSSPADDDDIDLFGSDEDNEDDLKLREERVQAYANKKAKKPALVAKSSVVLDVKPWDDETDMKAVETAVRAIGTDGLVWGASKLVPLAYGISKLQIVAIVEDEKVSVDWLQETISEIEELVQSVDIAAFNKL